MRSLTVLYDADCGFCLRCMRWLQGQAAYVPLRFVPLGSEAAGRFALPAAAAAGELTVIDDEGGLYSGHAAYLMCLYALRDYREWSLRMANPALWPLARRALEWVTSHRRDLSRFFAGDAHVR
jgi:predicted DCC family thiol-disulfide oxidoreductase YuxK